MISDHDFYHYGWELSATDIVSFGKRFEERAKLSMRTYVGTFHCVGLPFKMSIHRFQDRFGFTEDTWSYESIKKDFYRNGVVDEIDFEADILLKIENIILRGLSVLGTNCIDKINEHEST